MASPSIQTPKKNQQDKLFGVRLEHKPKGLICKEKLGFAQYNQQDGTWTDASSLTDLENTIFIKSLSWQKGVLQEENQICLGTKNARRKRFVSLPQ